MGERFTRPVQRARTVFAALALPGIVILSVGAALAQQHKPAAPAVRAAPAKKPPAATPIDAGGFGSRVGPLAPGGPAAGSASVDAGVVEAKTLDGGTHVFKFTELDIEGRLKSPQLVYFLRRVRAEFAASDLGHRTFLREMSETRKESSF
jgi:hypothetical protein